MRGYCLLAPIGIALLILAGCVGQPAETAGWRKLRRCSRRWHACGFCGCRRKPELSPGPIRWSM
jgi:hypothetical protein